VEEKEGRKKGSKELQGGTISKGLPLLKKVDSSIKER